MGAFTLASLIPAVITITAVFLCVDLGLIEFKRPTPWIVAIACTLVVCVVGACIKTAYGASAFRHCYPIIVILPLFFLSAAFHRTGLSRSIFTFIYVVSLVHINFAVLDLVGVFFPGINDALAFVISLAVAALTAALVHYYFHSVYQDVQDYMPSGWGLGCALVGVGAVALIVLSFFQGAINATVFAVVECVLVIYQLALIYVVLGLFKTISANNRAGHDADIARVMRTAQRRVDEVQQHNEAEERRRRHDLRHAIQVIIDEVESGDNEAAVEHLVQLRGDNLVKTSTDYCDNAVVNSVIKLWATRAGESGIDMTVRADVPNGLKIDDIELASMISNLLENAYEACMRLERVEYRRYIDVKCTYKQGKLLFAMENSCRTDVRIVDGMPLSQKRGGGIGTYSARATVEQHGGMIRYETKDGVFFTRFIIAV